MLRFVIFSTSSVLASALITLKTAGANIAVGMELDHLARIENTQFTSILPQLRKLVLV
jgi:hypothetical protein